MHASHPTADDLRQALQTRVHEFGGLTGMSVSAIGVHAVNDAAVIDRIVSGENFRVDTYSRLMDWLDRNWPKEGAIATPDQFDVMQSAMPRRIKDLRASLVYRLPRGGKARRPEREGECMAPVPRLVVGLPIFALREWPFHPDQGFVFARGASVVRILTADGGVPLVISSRGGGTFHFGYMPAIGDKVQPKEWVPFRRLEPAQAGGAVIEIDSPDWLRAAS